MRDFTFSFILTSTPTGMCIYTFAAFKFAFCLAVFYLFEHWNKRLWLICVVSIKYTIKFVVIQKHSCTTDLAVCDWYPTIREHTLIFQCEFTMKPLIYRSCNYILGIISHLHSHIKHRISYFWHSLIQEILVQSFEILACTLFHSKLYQILWLHSFQSMTGWINQTQMKSKSSAFLSKWPSCNGVKMTYSYHYT